MPGGSGHLVPGPAEAEVLVQGDPRKHQQETGVRQVQWPLGADEAVSASNTVLGNRTYIPRSPALEGKLVLLYTLIN